MAIDQPEAFALARGQKGNRFSGLRIVHRTS
jgi:hypothetical protein